MGTPKKYDLRRVFAACAVGAVIASLPALRPQDAFRTTTVPYDAAETDEEMLPSPPALGYSQGSDQSGSEDPQDSSRVVTTFAQFQAALEDDQTTAVYFGADIAMESGIHINPGKPSLIIDGTDPDDPDGIVHTWTDYHSSAETDTVRVRTNAGPKEIVVRNLNVVGKNHYGFLNVHSDAKNVTVLYDNVTYRGPQMTFNRFGTSHYRNTHVEIARFGGASAPGEVGEVSNVILEGRVSLAQVEDYQENEFFFFAEKAGDLTILPGATVTASTPFNAGFIHAAVKVSLELMEDASLSFAGKNRFWEGTPLTQVTLHPGSELNVTIDSPLNTLLRVNGPLTAERDSELYLQSRGSTAFPALYLVGGAASFHDPKRVVLYTPTYRNIAFEPANSLSIEAQQVNYWTATGAGNFFNMPDSRWWKTNGELFSVSGSVSAGAEGNFTSLSSNYDPVDSGGDSAPDAENFHMKQARMLSFGYLPLSASYEDTPAPSVTGYTEPHAALRLQFSYGEEAFTQYGEADESGGFFIPLERPAADGDRILVEASSDYLFAQAFVTVSAQELFFEQVPGPLHFPATPVPPFPQLVPREDPDWQLTIMDSLYEGNEWRLSVQPLSPLTATAGGTGSVLYDALVYVDATGRVLPLSPERQTVLHQQFSRGAGQSVSIRWAADRGLLVLADPGELRSGIDYSATLRWILEIVP